jgi:hypothetical protein
MTKSKETLNFKWCLENDFQVYIEPLNKYPGCNKFVVVVRRGGIKSNGLDSLYKDNNVYRSKAVIGEKIYRNTKDASEGVREVHEMLRQRYG